MTEPAVERKADKGADKDKVAKYLSKWVSQLGRADINALSVTENIKMVARLASSRVDAMQMSSKRDAAVERATKDYKPGRSSSFCAQVIFAIKDQFEFQDKLYKNLEQNVTGYRDIELMKYTGHGKAAIDNALNMIGILRGSSKELSGEYADVWRAIGQDSAFQHAVELKSDSPAPEKLDRKIEGLRALAEAMVNEADAAMTGIAQSLERALKYEAVKAGLVKLLPDKADEAIETAEKIAGHLAGGAEFAAKLPVPSGSAKKALEGAAAIVDVLNAFVGRAVESWHVDRRVKKTMKDPAKVQEALDALDQAPVLVANYLRDKYVKTVDQYIALVNFGEQAVTTAIFAGIGAATYGASEPVTAIVGDVVSLVTGVMKQAVRSFLVAVQDERVNAALEQLKEANAANLVDIAGAAAKAAESFFEKYMKEAPKRMYTHVSDAGKENVFKLLSPFGMAESGISAFFDSIIRHCVAELDIEPAQIFTGDMLLAAVAESAPEKLRHDTARS
ncbi:MAG TPA: hypothetical protein VGH27_06270 [Streptosporangiaceae bacterium]|jgi:hypothetical protein